MTALPARTPCHRLIGWHAPRLRRLEVGAAAAVIVFAATVVPLGWELALLVGWDVAACQVASDAYCFMICMPLDTFSPTPFPVCMFLAVWLV